MDSSQPSHATGEVKNGYFSTQSLSHSKLYQRYHIGEMVIQNDTGHPLFKKTGASRLGTTELTTTT